MSFTRRCAAWTGMGLVLALLAGCPFLPQLSVTPLTIALGGAATSANFRVENAGGGTLAYTITEDIPWIDISAQGGAPGSRVEGSITTDVAFIQVVLNRSALPAQGVSRGEIAITSNAGSQTVIVSATQVGQPLLQVSRTTIDFGLTGATEQFTITNGGNAQLEWTLAFPATAAWLNVQPRTGVLESFGKQAVVTVNVSRTGVAAQAEPYTSAISIVSNGGDASVAVSMGVPPFTVQPNSLDFGRTEGTKSKSLTVENNGTLPVVLAVTPTTDSGGNWLAVNNASPTLPTPGPLQITATANAAGLAPGSYTGSIKVDATALSYSQIVPVTLSVPGFSVAPSTLAFGSISSPATLPLTLTNLGATPIQWSAALPANTPWLSMTATSGTLATTQTINVTATPATVDPGQYDAQITFTFDGGQDTIAVTMTRPKPAALKVAPQDMDFGVTRTETTMGLWNDGLGTINWSIDTAGFPAWLSLAPVNGSGVASGTVSGDITDTVAVRVNRSLAPAGLDVFEFTFNVAASGDSTTPVPVHVRASAPKLPEFGIVGEGIDAFGVPYVRLDITEDSQDFVVANTGDGPLSWSIPPETQLPVWITSISPQQGTVNPNRRESVTVTVDRSTLSRAGATFRLPLVSNDPSRPLLVVEIQVRVPYSIIIGVKPTSIAFGRLANTALMYVANLGDEGEYLNFKITSSQPDWLFVEPVTGRSIGVPPTQIKDYQEISVAIDRSRIQGQGGVAKLVIEAVDVPEDALPVQPVEVQVSVDLAKLTMETAVNTLRPPSLVRMNVLLRDQAYKVFPSLEDIFTDTRTFYNVPNVMATFLEDSQAIDLNETNVFVKKDENLSFDVLVMLDFSGSMRAAAQALVDDGQFPAGGDPLNALYVQCIGPMLAEFPPHYRVALSVFNERRPAFEDDLRIIYGADAAHPQLAGDAFVRDKDVLEYRINNMDVADNGATALLPAILSGAVTLADIDSIEHYVPFDTAAESVIVAVTDGRRTTPPGDLSPIVDFLDVTRVRVFPIGWGQTVQANTLITLSSGSGGHFYSPQTKKNADAIDVPQASELLRWCRTEPGNPSAQSVPRDLRSHISLSYPSLNEMASMTLEARVEMLDVTPSVNAAVTIDGEPMAVYANDVRLGQIGMRTGGINPGGVTSVFVFMDYAPRNLAKLGLQLSVDSPDAVTSEVVVVPEEKGGLMQDWTRADAGNQYTFTAPTGRMFRYGDYGELVEVRVTGAVNPFKVRLAVVDPVIGLDRDGKYFTCPDTITVGDGPFKATSFPRPRVFSVMPDEGFIAPPRTLDLPVGETAYKLDVYNLGGAHAPTIVRLNWLASMTGSYLPGTSLGQFDVLPVLGGSVISTESPGLVTVKPDLTLEPGVYSGALLVEYDYGSLNIEGTDGPYYLRYTINPPELTVSQTSLDFGDTTIDLPLTIGNGAQGELLWYINAGALPVWLEVLNSGSVLGPNESVTFNVRVHRDAVASGDYNTAFTIVGDNEQSQDVQIHMTKP